MSLFSRARPGKPPVQKKIRGFLALSGELRNEVYEYYFEEAFRCEIIGEHTDFEPLRHKMMKLGKLPLEWPLYVRKPKSKSIRISRRLDKYTRVEGLKTNWSTSLCPLILVCKQIHRETIVFLYHNTTFVFNGPKRMRYFMNSTPTDLSLITKLELHYTNYGECKGPKDGLKEKHHKAWVLTCKAVAKRFVNLQELTVWMYITASPLWFDLRQGWLAPLLPFRRANLARQSEKPDDESDAQAGSGLKGLKRVKVHFDTHWSRPDAFVNNQALTDASRTLHVLFGCAIAQAIMGKEEEYAMAPFNAAWEVKYVRWKHHLNFSVTGW